MTAALTGTASLIRLALRRDRIRLPIWVVLLVVIPGVTPPSFAELFPTEAARAAYAGGVTANPALLALQGPMYGTSLGALTAGRSLSLTAVLVALMSVLTVIRHTRAEEEAGRRELLGAGVVGRHAGLAAALAVAVGAGLVIATGVAVLIAAAGLPVAGSVLMGLALAAVGIVFAAVAAVAAQLTEGARAATGITLGVLGLAFLARAAGDGGSVEWLSWLSPLGWAARTQPFTGDRWWVLGLALGTAAVLAGLAFALSARRDLAAGVLPARLGPAHGALGGPFGLAWRLHRASLLGWTAAFAVAGAAFGGIAQGIGDVLDSSPEIVELLRQLGGGDGIVDVFLAAEFGILGLLAAAYGIGAALRLRSEETDGRAENVLATAVGRTRWTSSHLVVALFGPALALLTAGLAAGLVHGAALGDVDGQVPRLVVGAVAQLPAVWVLVGIALALFGVFPRAVVGAWAVLVVFLLFGQFGQLLSLPQWLLDLSPFTHLPRTLGTEIDTTPLVWMVVITAALLAVGFIGIRRRDVG
ncbi:ABC transporter permease [Pseudonocardia sp.]|uniref:ABC transporter permease n=1 Tax=Pseudonocardia sp. TaxID=60912 RepID=UPI00262C4774|nr:ABC transporter permease [Pseudonocardia sp.]